MIPINLNIRKVEFPRPSTDNLHRIAISNLQDPERLMVRWWAKKYRQPLKGFEEHTWEELFIEQLEDFYAANPVEAERFLHEVGQRKDDDDWDGTVPDEEGNARRARGAQVKESGHVDLSKYQKDGGKKFSNAEVAQIMDNLGRNLPGSKVQKASAARPARQEPQTVQALGGEEFDDVF